MMLRNFRMWLIRCLACGEPIEINIRHEEPDIPLEWAWVYNCKYDLTDPLPIARQLAIHQNAIRILQDALSNPEDALRYLVGREGERAATRS